MAVIVVGSSGCAAIRQRGATQEQAALGRQMCREGVDALECGELANAQKLLRTAAAADPDYGDARRHLAEALWRSGDHREALTHAELACQCDPLDAHGAVRAGQMRLDQGDASRAIEWATQAIAVEQRLASAWALRGRALWNRGETDLAVADLQQALRYAPDDEALLRDLAQLYHTSGDERRTLTTLHQLLDAYAPGEEPVEVLAMTGSAYLSMGRPQDAADTLREAAARGEAPATLLCQLAEAEAACGRLPEAIAGAQRALAADAGHGPAHALLARLAAGGAETSIR
ncbi:tetratricopeptide repeat protein [Botrimarina hoheduenensis]|uniref:Tetratricopeptide repeat protein n=2 Tax=Botrimarina hoheduenensis TaxID=2528000 RepID=A0A5C5VTY6_9BACT|nr:tetratricopeptide repeat protein [Botrimarina hoheduenensis]